MQDYHDLLLWKKTLPFVKLVYEISKNFPKEEMFGLISQLRRAAVSGLANIAEGRGKFTDKDFLRFLYISKGSLNECQCYFELALELAYIDKATFDKVDSVRKEVGFLLYKLMASLNNP